MNDRLCNRDNTIECTEKNCNECSVYIISCNETEFEEWKQSEYGKKIRELIQK